LNIPDHIPTELIQRFTANQAWEYMLVPFEARNNASGDQPGGTKHGNGVRCLGAEGHDYTDAQQEIEVLYGMAVTVETIAAAELEKLLHRYYRTDGGNGRGGHLTRESHSHQRQTRSITEIGTGQGFLMGLIEEAFDTYSSDIHIEAYEERCRVRFRIDGKLIERYVVEKGNYASLVNQIKIIAGLDISEKRLPQDGRILYNRNGKKFDVRVSCLPTIYGEKIVMRLLTRHIELLELSNLGFTERQMADYCRAIERPHGMILICGPTGSGKSTTLYATLRRLNRLTGNILTIEDPVDYTLEGVNQVQLKEEIGLTFSSALRTFLRQDPDIIMLGEIRDADTAQMAIRSSLTGHLIFSTIHTNTAWGSIARLADMGIHPYLVANTLVMCVAQRLVRLLCPHCKREEEAGAEVAGVVPGAEIKSHYTAVGCDKCYYTGYSGRRAIYEVIPLDDELAAAARREEADIEEMLRRLGIITLREAGIELFRRGDTSLEEVVQLLKS
jgi:general secretion pathway protein E/type IV pilus assembly protein PilB